MHSTNSYLYTLLERIRSYLDEPDVDAKYSNDYIIRHVICPAQVDVLSRLNNTVGSPVLNRFSLTLDADLVDYQLPPTVQEVVQIGATDDDGNNILDIRPRDRMDYRGKNWSLEGSPGCLLLNFDNFVGTNSLDVWYVSNGDILPHYGTGSLSTTDLSGNTQMTFTLMANPATLGVIDRRPNAYVGQILRLIPATGLVEERIIASQDTVSVLGANPTITVAPRVDFETTKALPGSFLYEIAPAGSQMLYEAIALWSAIKLGTGRKITKDHRDSLIMQYKAAMKTIGDNLTNIQTRSPAAFERATVDNPQTLGWGTRART